MRNSLPHRLALLVVVASFAAQHAVAPEAAGHGVAGHNAGHNASSAHGGGGHGDPHGEPHGHGHIGPVEAKVMVFTITALILLSILFEAGRERMEEHAGSELLGLVHALFAELAVLGFIGFLTFLTIRVGLGALLSEVLLDARAGELPFVHMLEDLHMVRRVVFTFFGVFASLLREQVATCVSVLQHL